jgi:hypothetical protein
VTKGSWDRKDDSHQCANDGKDNGAKGMIRKSVDDLGGGQDMETDEDDVVGEEHESAELVSNSALAKNVVSKIAWKLLLVLFKKHLLPQNLQISLI